jgi:Patatin-like phospholipase
MEPSSANPAGPPQSSFSYWMLLSPAYLYFNRVPILSGTALALFAPVALWHSHSVISSMFGGIFDISGPDWWRVLIAFFIVSVASCFAADAVRHSMYAISYHAPERFGVPEIPGLYQHRNAGELIRVGIVVSLVGGAFWNTSGPFLFKLLGIGAGVFCFGLISTYVEFRMHEARPVAHSLVFWWDFIPGSDLLANALAKRARSHNDRSPSVSLAILVSRACVSMLKRLKNTDGYQERENPGDHLSIDHEFGVYFFLAASVLYLAGWLRPLMNRPPFSTGDQPLIPTLFMLICFTTVACWILCFLSFFFDKYRIPLVMVVVVLFYVSSNITSHDHFFDAQRLSHDLPRLNPSDVLDARLSGHRLLARKVVVVASTGGGIQSAAWTAKVLNGLIDDCEIQAGQDCHQAIRAISSVSGGSVGAMYFAAAYDPATGRLPLRESRNALVLENATASSLEDVTWGLVYPDFLKVLVPVPALWPVWVRHDRGFFLETSWVRTPALRSATIGRWREDVRKGVRPATLFNSTMVETGRQLVFGTSNIASPCASGDSDCEARAVEEQEGYREMHSAYKNNVDVSVPTAVRLSATFPYVTDAARIDLTGCESCENHIADGGYYDNFGMHTLLIWLDHALERQTGGPREQPVDQVLVVQIRSSPKDVGKTAESGGGLSFSGSVPLSTMLSVWNISQAARNDAELRWLTEKWRSRSPRVEIETAVFQFGECARAQYLQSAEPLRDVSSPLSWHLTAADKKLINEEWDRCAANTDEASEIGKVRSFFTAATRPSISAQSGTPISHALHATPLPPPQTNPPGRK